MSWRREAVDDESETELGATLKAKFNSEALREQVPVADWARRYDVRANQIYVWRKQGLDHAERGSNPEMRLDAEVSPEREAESLHAGIDQLAVEHNSLAKVWKMSTLDGKALLGRPHARFSLSSQCCLPGVAHCSVQKH